MTAYPIAGSYVVLQHRRKGGGWIGRGRTLAEAIGACMKAIRLTPLKVSFEASEVTSVRIIKK